MKLLYSRSLAPLRAALPARWRNAVRRWLEGVALDNLVTADGHLESTRGISPARLLAARSYFMRREQLDVAMTAATSWYGGDYLEFGSADLRTFRNMLSSFHIAGLDERFPDTRFYAFDIFGKTTSTNPATQAAMTSFDAGTRYFSDQYPAGDDLARHQKLVRDHGLFISRCHLVQGFFQDTLTPARKAAMKAEKHEIGFAFIDCNMEEFYKVVLEFIYELMAPNSYIYMDEYFQSSGASRYFDDLARKLRADRGIECMYVRSAGGFGGLFRLRPVRAELAPLAV